MMNRYGLVYSSSDAERVDGLTYAWRKLHAQVCVVICRGSLKANRTLCYVEQCCDSMFSYKITEMLCALSLVDSCVQMRVCKRGCDVLDVLVSRAFLRTFYKTNRIHFSWLHSLI